SIPMGDTYVSSLSFSPDGKLLALGCTDHVIRLWDVEQQQQLTEPSILHGAVNSIAFSPDGQTLATGSGKEGIHLWEVPSGRLLRGPLEPSKDGGRQDSQTSATYLNFSPDGKLLATGGSRASTAARVFSVPDGRRVKAFMGHRGPVTTAGFSNDGNRLITGSRDRSVKIWFYPSGKLLREWVLPNEVGTAAFSPDGKLAAASSLGSVVKLWDIVTGKELASFTQRGGRPRFAFSQGGSLLAVSLGQELRIVDVASLKTIHSLAAPAGTRSWRTPRFSPDNQTLAAAANNEVHLFDPATGELRSVITQGHVGLVHCIRFSPQGKILATAGADSTVLLWDLKKILASRRE
ncbi:MAG: WD40 repeat domain-containing protein, partial [Planctomycetales bacterium]